MMPRSSKISCVRGWMPLPREPRKRIVHLLDQAEGYTPARKVDREREAGSAGTANQHLGCQILCHRHLLMCNMHIIGGSACRQEKECKMHIYPNGSGPCTEH